MAIFEHQLSVLMTEGLYPQGTNKPKEGLVGPRQRLKKNALVRHTPQIRQQT